MYNLISMSTIDEIKARIDIVDLVSESVQLRRSGKNYTGFLPVPPQRAHARLCRLPGQRHLALLRAMQRGGDIFRFVMKRDGVDFGEALRTLAEKAGVELKAPTPEEQALAEEHDELRALLEEAVVFYRHHLLNTPAGKIALDYLRQKRGLRDETIEGFDLGYAPDAWETALAHFRSKGYSEQILFDCGLITEREGGAGTMIASATASCSPSATSAGEWLALGDV